MVLKISFVEEMPVAMVNSPGYKMNSFDDIFTRLADLMVAVVMSVIVLQDEQS